MRRVVKEGFNLFVQSGELEEYREGYTVLRLDGRDSSLEFVNGLKLFAGEVRGMHNEQHLRRIQIRETILSHLEREQILFAKGVKVLSLFFIDEVAKYKQYDAANQAFNGEYAEIFEEEYAALVAAWPLTDEGYGAYLRGITPAATHAGYFSIDKKSSRMVDSKLADKKERTSDDADAYELIMKNKERLLDRREPVRFLFSHSALREGWDNPNVFQICLLKQSGSDVRKRQEVGRGLRLAVNQNGERMDTNLLGEEVHNVNVLTIVANESYESFAKGLQSEIAAAVADRPRLVNADLFRGKVVYDSNGAEQVIDAESAVLIHEGLVAEGYLRKGTLTDKYYEDKKHDAVRVAPEVENCAADIIAILDSVYNPAANQPEDARQNNVELQVSRDKLASAEFKALWSKINAQSFYVVDFDEEELITKAITALNQGLKVSTIKIMVEHGVMAEIHDKEQLVSGESFTQQASKVYKTGATLSQTIKYDLVGKVVQETGLTRKAVVKILNAVEPPCFRMFQDNPEEFIVKVADIITEEKATVIIEHITYNKLDSVYDASIFTEPTLKGRLGVNAMAVRKHLYDYLLYDSQVERVFAEALDTSLEVAIYVKLPRGFAINTPLGRYNPDWAVAFHEGKVKHIYFVAETKGSLKSLQLRKAEAAKADCAREHFKAISSSQVIFDVVDTYETLLNRVMG